MSRRPIVGISEGFADYGDYYGFGYGRPLLAAGALPVLLPYYERADQRRELLGRLDGTDGRSRIPFRATPRPCSTRSSCTSRDSRSRRASRCSVCVEGSRC